MREIPYRRAWLILSLCVLAVLLITFAVGVLSDTIRVNANPTSKIETGGPSPTPSCVPHWQVSTIPSVGFFSGLYGVAAISATDIWAVGYYNETWDGPTFTLTFHWDGNQWTRIPSPSPHVGGFGSGLYSVAAISANNVWAVGYSDSGSAPATLTLHWDGAQWTHVPSPSPGTGEAYLQSVATVSVNDVWAVGYYDWPFPHYLALHWDGSQWTQVATPNPSAIAYLYGVTALASNDVWAVGFFRLSVNPRIYNTTTMHWDGTVWSVIPSPNPTTDSELWAVTATSPTNVRAVGESFTNTVTFRFLDMRWDGAQWALIKDPTFQPPERVRGADAISPDDVWAVGSGSDNQALLLHWNGIEWSRGSIAPSQEPTKLHGVAMISPNDVWTVGEDHAGSEGGYALIGHYTGGCSTVTPTPTIMRTNTHTPTAPPTWTPTGTLSPTGTPTNMPTGLPSDTPVPTSSSSPSVLATSTLTASTTITPYVTVTPTSTPCAANFSDVHPSDYFYQAVSYLYCAGVISGYADGTFRPYNDTTRAHLTKIVVLAKGWPVECPVSGHFSDVPSDSPFYCYIETAYAHNVLSGYVDGTFRPGNNVTRAQLCKIIVLAMEWALDCLGAAHFSDVPVGNPFFCYVETAYGHGIISGYSDGTFRPGNSAIRGQICKIVYQAITTEKRN